MLDFNSDDYKQTSGNRGPIPPDSCVILQMEIRTPRSGKEGSHPLLCRAASGNEYLDVQFTVVRGQFEGKQLWNNYTVQGSEMASKISMRTLRAIVESARGIDPNDGSPAATANRRLNDWTDFNGLQFMAKLDAKCEENKGEWYVNNHIKKVITCDMEEYAIVAQDGELITDKPLPEKPATTAAKPAAAAGGWGAPAAPAPAAPAPAAPAAAAASGAPAVPNWAKK